LTATEHRYPLIIEGKSRLGGQHLLRLGHGAEIFNVGQNKQVTGLKVDRQSDGFHDGTTVTKP